MGKIRVVSYSELDALRQCPLKRHLAYTERWVTPTTKPALARGSAWHTRMEAHYNTIMRIQAERKAGTASPRSETVGLLQQVAIENPLEVGVEDDELLAWMYNGYLQNYGADEEWEILGVEMAVQEPLRNERGNRTGFVLKGKVDLLIRDHSSGGGLWVVDHKTGKDLPKGKQFDFDDQFGIYVWLLRQRGMDIRGVIYNACRTYKLKTKEMAMNERFDRHLTVRSDEELRTMTLEAYEEFRSSAASIRHLGGPDLAAKGVLPQRRPDPDRCGWRCDYTEACLMSRGGRDIRELLQDMGAVQDPTRH